MHRRACAGIVAIVAAIAACKKTALEAGSGPAGSGSAAGSTTPAAGSSSAGSSSAGSSNPGSLPAAGSNGSGRTGSGSAGSGSADSGAPANAGSANAGSASAGSANAGSASAGYDKAAFLADPLCEQIADKIRACVDKAEFIAALDDGATAQQKKVNARLRKGVKKWQKAHELCTNAWDILNYEYTGFLDKPSVFKAPSALSSCAELGAAVKAGGGLVGGDTAE